MKKAIGIVLVLAAVALGIYGYQQYDQHEADVSIGDIELSVENKDNTHLYLWIAGGVCLIAGIVTLSNKK